MKTALTQLLGIKYPILNAGMGWVALPNIVVAVSEAGGLGVFGAGSQPPELVRERIREIRKQTDRPFGINCPLALPNAIENAKVAIEEEVPVINYSMGRGDWIAEAVAKYGGKTIASVNSVKLARSAQKHGADMIIAAGYEAAGHSGDIGTFVQLQRLKQVVDLPIIAAGGITDGVGLMGALALGASGVSMGTRFATSAESPWHDNFKNLALTRDIHDTVRSTKFDGFPNRMMKSEKVEQILGSALNPISAFFYSFKIARELDIPYPKLLKDVLSKGPAAAVDMMRMAEMLKYNKFSFEGDLKQGIVATGQSIGLVSEVLTVAEVMERIIVEAEEVLSRLNSNALEAANT